MSYKQEIDALITQFIEDISALTRCMTATAFNELLGSVELEPADKINQTVKKLVKKTMKKATKFAKRTAKRVKKTVKKVVKESETQIKDEAAQRRLDSRKAWRLRDKLRRGATTTAEEMIWIDEYNAKHPQIQAS